MRFANSIYKWEWLKKLTGGFFRIKAIRRLALVYLITFCIPLFLFLSLYYRQLMTNIAEGYSTVQRTKVMQATNAYLDKIGVIQSIPALFQQNLVFCNYADGQYIVDADRVYNYNAYVRPQINYTLRSYSILKDLNFYSLNPEFKIPPYYFFTEWPLEREYLDRITKIPGVFDGLWIFEINQERLDSITYYTRLYNANYSKQLAIVAICIDPAEFFKDMLAPSPGSILILQQKEQYYGYDGSSFIRLGNEDLVLDMLQKDKLENISISLFQNSSVTHSLRMDELDMALYFVTYFNFITPMDIFTIMIPMIICLLLFTSIFFVHLSTGTGNILRFSRFLQQVDYKNLSHYSQEAYPDEVNVLIAAYNKLVDNMHLLINNVYQAHIKSRSAQYYALQAQINPHFLINTLENIRMMAEINKDSETAKMIMMLGKIFQYNNDKDSIFSTLDKEIIHTCNYLDLCSMRMGRRLKYNISCNNDKIGSIPCPRNIIQPIVENSINHAFGARHDGCEIIIDIHHTDENILVSISDNGSGFTLDRLEAIRDILARAEEEGVKSAEEGVKSAEEEHTNVGLLNVHQRLRLFYGDKFGLELENNANGGATCRLRLRYHHQLPQVPYDL